MKNMKKESNGQVILKQELQRAGLPTVLRKVIKRMYFFVCEHGSHQHILVGTIIAIKISDEGGLDLYVTSPEIWGQKIKSIKKTDKGWAVYVSQDEQASEQSEPKSEDDIDDFIEERFFYGELKLI